jgi:O-antigen/teichoic acid export membrane protein
MRMVKDSVITYVSLFIQLGLSAFVAVFITRAMGLAVRGEISLILSVPGFLLAFGAFGTAHAIVYHLGKDNFSADQLIGATWILALLESGVVFLVVIPLWFMGRTTFLRGLDWRYLLFVVALSPAELLFNLSVYALRGMGRPDLFNAFRLLRSAVYFFFLLVAWLFKIFTVEYVLGAWAVALLIAALVAQARLWPIRKTVEGVRLFAWEPVGALFKYGLQLYPTVLLAFLGYRLDIYVINSMLAKSDVGAYTIAVSVAEIVWYIPNAVGIVLFPMIARMSDSEASDFTPLVVRQVLLLTFASVLGLLLVGHPLMVFAFGEEAATPAVPVLYLLLPGILAFSALKTVWQDLCGRGRPLLASISMFAAVAIDVALNLVITPRMGIKGAAISASVAYFCATVLIFSIYRRVTGVGFRVMLIPVSKDRDIYTRLIKKLGQRVRSWSFCFLTGHR